MMKDEIKMIIKFEIKRRNQSVNINRTQLEIKQREAGRRFSNHKEMKKKNILYTPVTVRRPIEKIDAKHQTS